MEFNNKLRNGKLNKATQKLRNNQSEQYIKILLAR